MTDTRKRQRRRRGRRNGLISRTSVLNVTRKVLAMGSLSGVSRDSTKQSIVKKYFPILQSSTGCNEAFANRPFISYRRPKNPCDYLVRAKINNNSLGTTIQASDKPGSYKCNAPSCKTCPYIDTLTHTPSSTRLRHARYPPNSHVPPATSST